MFNNITPDKIPDVIYHYCSLDTFSKIVQNRTIRLSNIFKMNDYSEVLHVLEPLQRMLEKEFDNEPFSFCYMNVSGKDAFIHLVADIKKDIEADKYLTYIACFSETDDDLYQWKAYGDDGKGVAIGLDGKRLFELAKYYIGNRCPLYLTDVSYAPDEQMDFLKIAVVPRTFDTLKKAQENGNVKNGKCTYEAMIRIMLSSYISAILLAAVRYKHHSYMAEKEWRLCLNTTICSTWPEEECMNFTGSKGYPKMEFRINANKLISFFDLQLRDFASNIIKKIILGPKSTIGIDDPDLRLFLKMNGFNIERGAIKRSGIPYS